MGPDLKLLEWILLWRLRSNIVNIICDVDMNLSLWTIVLSLARLAFDGDQDNGDGQDNGDAIAYDESSQAGPRSRYAGGRYRGSRGPGRGTDRVSNHNPRPARMQNNNAAKHNPGFDPAVTNAFRTWEAWLDAPDRGQPPSAGLVHPHSRAGDVKAPPSLATTSHPMLPAEEPKKCGTKLTLPH